MSKVIKVATWNVGQDLKNNEINEDSYKYIKTQIEQNEVDIIAFQEAITESNNLESLANYISQNTKLKYNEQISLSPSDMNENDKMGVAVCSKFKISNNENYILENPNLIYKKTETITYWLHDKGFNISEIKELNTIVIGGHCLPFHIFGETPLNYKRIYEKLEDKILNMIKTKKNVIVLGDFNYTNIFELFSNLKDKMQCVYEDENTRKNKQIDYILTTKNIKHDNYKIIDTRFDHKLCVAELTIN